MPEKKSLFRAWISESEKKKLEELKKVFDKKTNASVFRKILDLCCKRFL